MEVLRTFEYRGRELRLVPHESGPPTPARASSRRAPGAGRFEIGRVEVSLEGGELAIAAQVSGKNIAHIYAELLLKDASLDKYYGPVVREHVPAGQSKTTRGVSRPVWDDPVDISFCVRPSLHLLTDGVEWAFCFWVPEGYGKLSYRLLGHYTRAGGAAPFRACLTFDGGGALLDVVAYKERRGRSVPRALTPQEDDHFAPFVQVLTPSDDKGSWEVGTALSTTLTIRDRLFLVVAEPLMPGDYLAGVGVQDLDGGFTRRYTPVAIGD